MDEEDASNAEEAWTTGEEATVWPPDLYDDVPGTETTADVISMDADDEDVPPECPEGSPCDDDDPCTLEDTCNAAGECIGEPMFCDDGDPCTIGDFCLDGECAPGPDLCECDTDDDCTKLDDGDPCNGQVVCQLSPMPSTCKLDPETVIDCSKYEPGQCHNFVCDPEAGGCVQEPTNEDGACDDDDPCTLENKCVAGECVGDPLEACGIGLPCVFGNDCTEGFECMETMPGGYCSWDDCEAFPCPEGASCHKLFLGQLPVCARNCVSDQDCRTDEGYT